MSDYTKEAEVVKVSPQDVEKIPLDDAVIIAKNWVNTVLRDEGITNLGLEEVNHSKSQGTWTITLGFSRPWNTTRSALTVISGEAAVKRTMKVLTISDQTGEVLSMRNRDD